MGKKKSVKHSKSKKIYKKGKISKEEEDHVLSTSDKYLFLSILIGAFIFLFIYLFGLIMFLIR
jgi:hypothetical protein